MKKRLKLRVPLTLDEITMEQYQRWHQVAEKQENKNTYFLRQKTVEIMCNVPLKFVSTMAHKTVEEVSGYLFNMLAEETTEFERRFTHNGIEYGFIPDFENMSSGEYIDIEGNMGWDDWHRALAVMYRPIIQTHDDKYLIEKYDGIKNDHAMKSIKASTGIGALFFLISCIEILERDLKGYLNREVNLNPQWRTILTESGGGSIVSTPSLAMTFRKLMRSQVSTLTHF